MSFLDRPPDPYVALGISKDAKLPDIRSAHRKLTLKLHPDRCHDPTLKAVRQEEWMKVQQAYELLSDDTLRVQYDKQVKLFEMRKEMGRNYPKTRSNPFEFEIKWAEPKSPSHYSAPSHPNWMAKEYVQAAQRKEAPSERSRKRDKERVPPALPRADTLRAGDRVRGGEGSKLKNNVEYHEYDHDFDDSDSDPQPQLQSSKRNPLHPPGFSSLHKHTPWGDDDAVQIEEGIKERNRKAYEHFKTSVSEISQPSSFSRDGKIDSKADDPKSGDQIESKQPLPKLKLSSVPPSQLGLNVLNPETTNAAVDIVAVHGLGAIPEITWKDSKSGVNWLSDGEMLPKSVPEARIMRFGYDSLWLGKTPVRQKLSTIANKLLLVLSRERRNAPERPLIFIGHCFGGLVIQRALILAKLLETSNPHIFNSSVGVVFLGTPHRGTKAFLPQSALLAAIAAQSDLHGGIEAGVLDALRSDEGALLDVSDDFAKLCGGMGLLITCFFEQRESSLGKVIGRDDIQHFIVDDVSASIDGHPSYGLPLDHFRLNKFFSPEDGNFQDICGEIVRFYRIAKEKANMTASSNPRSELGTGLATAWIPEPLGPKKLARPRLVRSASGRLISGTKASTSSSSSSPNPAPSSSTSQYVISRQLAVEELEQEELRKEASMKEEQWERMYQERLVTESKQKESERIADKEAAERKYIDRLRTNMQKYKVPDVEQILNSDPLPNDKDLSEQEIKDKFRWYKNRVKGELLRRDIPGGEIDEILNDTGDTMIIDGVRTTYTRMALRWVSTRTLKAYDVPFLIDKDDPSSVIIKRWVPEYEQEFLWDHSRKLRERHERREKRQKDRENRPDVRRSFAEDESDDEYHSRRRQYTNKDAGISSTSERRRSADLSARHRNQSTESMRAPSEDDIARRRRHSRTLSGDRPVESSRRKQSSESVRSQRDGRGKQSSLPRQHSYDDVVSMSKQKPSTLRMPKTKSSASSDAEEGSFGRAIRKIMPMRERKIKR